jgi:hypothetical protein
MLNQPLPTSSKEVLMIYSRRATHPCSPALSPMWVMLEDWICLNSSTLKLFWLEQLKILLSASS